MPVIGYIIIYVNAGDMFTAESRIVLYNEGAVIAVDRL